ncbi:S-layer homology domain-containing protein [Paenibacillus cellulositrophicus]|uniref:S-layer homology domain-containing protein n=1 Tax=Paenibacillus cellulositrophicus TaxID=562959 RepID=UPI003F7D325A
MMTTLRRIAVFMSTAIFATSLALSSAKADSVSLPGVRSNHWAYSTIQWAVNNGVVKGYPDGSFKPSKNVSEAEFLMMFISAYQKVSPTSGQTHWADPVYDVAYKLNWPVKGVNNNAAGKAARDMSITRGEVANIIAGANGINYMGNDAIQYLLNTNLSSGKTGATVGGYKASDYLTRAEAVVFIKRALDQGLTELNGRPEMPSPKDDMPKPEKDLPKVTASVKDTIQKVISGSNAFNGYQVKAGDSGVSVYDGDGYASVNYKKATSSSGYDRVISFDAQNDASLKLATETMRAAGVPVTDDFTTKLVSTVQSGKDTQHSAGGYSIYIEPSETNANQITIKFKKK